MKTKLLSILAIGAIVMTSCKKEEEAETMGTATINGTIRADIDQTNDINGAGLYEANYMPEGVEGMIVRVEVNTQNWDESPVGGFDYAKKTYTTTTDADGKFSLEIPATAQGYNVTVRFETVNGVTRKLYSADGADVTELSYVTKGTETVFIYEGANLDKVYDANIYTEDASNEDLGMATVTGHFLVNWDNTADAPGHPLFGQPWEDAGSASPLAGKTLYWGYYNAPYGMGEDQLFPFTLDADGFFSIDVPTYVSSEFDNVDIYFGFDDFVADQVIDNQAMTADSTAASVYSIGGIQGIDVNGVEDGQVYHNAYAISVTNI